MNEGLAEGWEERALMLAYLLSWNSASQRSSQHSLLGGVRKAASFHQSTPLANVARSSPPPKLDLPTQDPLCQSLTKC